MDERGRPEPMHGTREMGLRARRLKVILGCFVFAGSLAGGPPTLADGLSVADGDSSLATRIADAFLQRHPDGVLADSGSGGDRWTYQQGLMLEAFRRMWLFTGRERYLHFIRANVDRFVAGDGSIRTYTRGEFNLDNIAGGRALLFLYQQTMLGKYRDAARRLRDQLRSQPRTRDGGFWHKKIYPQQMWLDGLYMAEPFYAEYARQFREWKAYDDIAGQFITAYRHMRDTATGLLRHGWDESRTQRWAEVSDGRSPCVWGRALGWYLMGLVDVLEGFPAYHPQRAELLRILQTEAAAILRFRDPATSLWYQVVDGGARRGNFLEASASAMFTYVFARGASSGLLDRGYFAEAEKSYCSILTHFVRIDGEGFVALLGTSRTAGLGGTPYRDGSFGYYVSVGTGENDMRGLGPLLLAAVELQRGNLMRQGCGGDTCRGTPHQNR